MTRVDMRADARHPVERLLAPVNPPGLVDPTWPAPDVDGEGLVECRPGTGEAVATRADDWHIVARLQTGPPRAGSDQVIQSFETADGALAYARREADGRVVVPFGFAEAYAAYTNELWAQTTRRGLPPGPWTPSTGSSARSRAAPSSPRGES